MIVERMTPTRVLINRDSEATSPVRAAAAGIVSEVIFVRRDGWSLGAPLKLREEAQRTWSTDWVAEWQRMADGTWYRRWPVDEAAQ